MGKFFGSLFGRSKTVDEIEEDTRLAMDYNAFCDCDDCDDYYDGDVDDDYDYDYDD